MIYFAIALFVLFPVLFFELLHKSKGEDRVYYWIECIVLILFMGLRYRVGGDSLRYEGYFEYGSTFSDILQYGFEKSYAQPLWQLLQGLCIQLFNSFYSLQIAQSAIVNVVIFYAAKHYCHHKFSFVALYYVLQYLYFNTEIMRESLAVACFLLSIPYLERGKWIWYYLFATIAFLFHATAIILFFIPFIYKPLSSKGQWKSIIYLIIILISVYLLLDRVAGVFIDTIFRGNDDLQLKASGLTGGSGLNIKGILVAAIFAIPIILSYRYLKDSAIDTPLNRFIINMSVVCTVLGILFLPLTRLQNYFVIPFLMIFADLAYDTNVRRKYHFSFIIAFMLLLFARLSYMASPISGGSGASHFKMYFPYHSVFDPIADEERERAIYMQFN